MKFLEQRILNNQHREVHLASNQLASFPLAFCGLTQLELLDLSSNSITWIPAEISSLQALELNLNNNKVIQFFDSLFFPDIEHPSRHLWLPTTSNPETGAEPTHPRCSSYLHPQVNQTHPLQPVYKSCFSSESKVSLLNLDGNNIDKKALVRLSILNRLM